MAMGGAEVTGCERKGPWHSQRWRSSSRRAARPLISPRSRKREPKTAARVSLARRQDDEAHRAMGEAARQAARHEVRDGRRGRRRRSPRSSPATRPRSRRSSSGRPQAARGHTVGYGDGGSEPTQLSGKLGIAPGAGQRHTHHRRRQPSRSTCRAGPSCRAACSRSTSSRTSCSRSRVARRDDSRVPDRDARRARRRRVLSGQRREVRQRAAVAEGREGRHSRAARQVGRDHRPGAREGAVDSRAAARGPVGRHGGSSCRGEVKHKGGKYTFDGKAKELLDALPREHPPTPCSPATAWRSRSRATRRRRAAAGERLLVYGHVDASGTIVGEGRAEHSAGARRERSRSADRPGLADEAVARRRARGEAGRRFGSTSDQGTQKRCKKMSPPPPMLLS